MMDINIELPVTYKCDWNCSYCCAFTHSQPDINFNDLIKKAEQLPDGANVSITGGEPGLISKKKIKKVIKILKEKNCVIDLLTNGLFLKKHQELLKYISKVIYHCLENLDQGVIQFPDEDQSFTDYILVVLPEDMDENVLTVMDKYPHIKFRLVPTKLINSNTKMYFKFIKFFKAHSHRLHENTMSEFVNEMVRKPNSIKAYNGN